MFEIQSYFAVEAMGLTKKYGATVALADSTVRLAPNKLYGLLGRNGVGKTTFLNILTSRIFPDSGTFSVLSGKPYENVALLKKICMIEEKGYYPPSMKIGDIFRLCAEFYPGWDTAYSSFLAAIFGLDQNKKYGQLSRGMESIVGITIGLASRAPLTIFDEPSLSIDSVSRQRFYDILKGDFATNPRTVIISTHLIDELSTLFEDIIIMDGGRILFTCNTSELVKKAFYLTGPEEEVRAAARESRALVLGEERLPESLTLMVFTKFEIVARKGVKVRPVPLQKLFNKLIDPRNVGMFAGGMIL